MYMITYKVLSCLLDATAIYFTTNTFITKDISMSAGMDGYWTSVKNKASKKADSLVNAKTIQTHIPVAGRTSLLKLRVFHNTVLASEGMKYRGDYNPLNLV